MILGGKITVNVSKQFVLKIPKLSKNGQTLYIQDGNDLYYFILKTILPKSLTDKQREKLEKWNER
jgi:hypothetical protein